MSCLNSQSEDANSGQFCPRHHDLYMEKIEFHKKIFIHQEITGPSQNLIFSQCVLSFFQVEYRVVKERLPPVKIKPSLYGRQEHCSFNTCMYSM